MSGATIIDPDRSFEVVEPRRRSLPLVFNSPHSGRCYSESFLAASKLDCQAIRRSEDSYVDALVTPAAALGAPLLKAHFPRAWLDVNREPYELDPAMFRGPLPAFANSRSPRVASGLGTIARIVAESQEIYAGRLDVAEAMARIDGVYKPYHATLKALVDRARAEFGHAVLLDCHSMPSSARGPAGRRRPDFVVGDRHGASCGPAFTAAALEALLSAGFTVARNKPYAGGFITEHYGRPTRGLHALQVEVNRALYMDEETLEPHDGFAAVQSAFMAVAEAVIEVDPGISGGFAASGDLDEAAE